MLHIERSVWNGIATLPKTSQSAGYVPVISPLSEILNIYRLRCGNLASGPMFANGAGKPACLDNLLTVRSCPPWNAASTVVIREADSTRGKITFSSGIVRVRNGEVGMASGVDSQQTCIASAYPIRSSSGFSVMRTLPSRKRRISKHAIRMLWPRCVTMRKACHRSSRCSDFFC